MDRLEVARYASLPEAELVVVLLRDHGIDAEVADREMANSAPHLQVALGGIRVTAPEAQIVDARDLAARARRGELESQILADDDGEWMDAATPGRIGELDEAEVHGVLGSMKTAGRIMIMAFLILPVAGCLAIVLFAN